MALLLERRNEKGELTGWAQFFEGYVLLKSEEGDDLELSVDEARQLAKVSSHLPVEKRDWALRLSFKV